MPPLGIVIGEATFIVPPINAFPTIPTPPDTFNAPVVVLEEFVALETTNVPDRSAFVANVFHLKVAEPKL